MTVEQAGSKWGYSKSRTKRLKALCLGMPNRFPIVSGHLVLPDDTPKIFVPDKRSKNARGYFYRYILDAIGTDSLLYPESIGITESDKMAHLRALLENNEIERKQPNSCSWETCDFMITRNGNWGKKSSDEKRSYISELVTNMFSSGQKN